MCYKGVRACFCQNLWSSKLTGLTSMHAGKILYPECKKGVWPPSDWDPHLAERSAQLPDSRLALEFVYGYDG